MLTEIISSIDLISTFLTLSYLVWLISREWSGSSLECDQGASKRSLMNQHVADRHAAWA